VEKPAAGKCQVRTNVVKWGFFCSGAQHQDKRDGWIFQALSHQVTISLTSLSNHKDVLPTSYNDEAESVSIARTKTLVFQIFNTGKQPTGSLSTAPDSRVPKFRSHLFAPRDPSLLVFRLDIEAKLPRILAFAGLNKCLDLRYHRYTTFGFGS
jgi:hypothetical protein